MASIDGVDDKSLDLLSQIVSANVSAAAHTTNLLVDSLTEQATDFARTIVAIADVLANATVIDRKTEESLRWMYARIDAAQRYLDRQESQS